ncbi:hypothetical protein DAPPUDRAFT_234085 [Daphnia pulex]|uniref:Uncharacterized protein n=1 Tax=Daphnia pulex TaxID=6669 RepID=E9FUI9_DAPPU|nr:hypothetical protein DAPPUDRAFT_234085 [Daphnia pulex]|eukprot:EFX88737.1 hypothetical protein DAPPUDRAFT_234085 [Daphnia pulex]
MMERKDFRWAKLLGARRQWPTADLFCGWRSLGNATTKHGQCVSHKLFIELSWYKEEEIRRGRTISSHNGSRSCGRDRVIKKPSQIFPSCLKGLWLGDWAVDTLEGLADPCMAQQPEKLRFSPHSSQSVSAQTLISMQKKLSWQEERCQESVLIKANHATRKPPQCRDTSVDGPRTQFPSGVGVFKKLSGPNDSGGVWGRMGGNFEFEKASIEEE